MVAKSSSLGKVHLAIQRLASMQQGEGGDGERCRLIRLIVDLIVVHVQVPMAQAKGATSLAHNIAAFVACYVSGVPSGSPPS